MCSAGEQVAGRSEDSAAECAPALLELVRVDLASGEPLPERRHRRVIRRPGALALIRVPDQPANADDDSGHNGDQEPDVHKKEQRYDPDVCHKRVPLSYPGWARTMIRTSVMSSIAQRSPSRPSPESLTPPYGMWSIR